MSPLTRVASLEFELLRERVRTGLDRRSRNGRSVPTLDLGASADRLIETKTTNARGTRSVGPPPGIE